MLNPGRDLGLPSHGRFDFVPLLESTIASSQQSDSVDTISVSEEVGQPLAPFSQAIHCDVFGTHTLLDSEASAPARPATFSDRYLLPSMSRNEYLRLHTLWYYTRGLQDDVELLQKLSQILDMVSQSLGSLWEIGIVGIVEAETFARIVTTNIPLSCIPRRESPCSHTINQYPGTVLTIRDMQEDWRFKSSPSAEYNGIRSYAGTQILLTGQNAETVSIGSLCLASRSVQPALTETQKRSLIRAANMISGEIVTKMRLSRMTERQKMTETLGHLRLKHDASAFESIVLASLQRHYGDCDIRSAGVIDGRASLTRIFTMEICDINGGLWEDETFVKDLIGTKNFPKTSCERPVRAVFGSMVPHEKLIAVSTYDIRYIFDDLDVWFVEQCASILHNAQQARSLQDALAAKERFLSTVRHELRTPIHGILSSTELLADELRARNLLDISTGPNQTSLASFLQTIRSSGIELMTTVNNILRLQTIASPDPSSAETVSLSDCVEIDLLNEVLANYAEDSLTGLAIRFSYELGVSSMVKVDWQTVKEVLKALLFNAIAATQNGQIVLTTSFNSQDGCLCFDVVDSGIGISKEDHKKIFVAFEKLQEHSRGAGLGLSLASMMATALNGKLTLVSSQEGVGSHFRLTIPYVEACARPAMSAKRWSRRAKHIPRTYYVSIQSDRNLHLLTHLESYLKAYGLESSNEAQGSLIISNEPNPFSTIDLTALLNTTERHLLLVVSSSIPSDSQMACLAENLLPHQFMIVTGPLYTSRLDEILDDADTMLAQPLPALASLRLQQPSTSTPPPHLHSGEATPPVTPCVELEGLAIADSGTTAVPLKVLLVDDNKVNLSVLQMFCKRRMYDFGSAMNGIQAVHLYKAAVADHAPYDLVLMDLQMPEMGGIEATTQIREFEMNQGLRRSILLIITGQDRPADRKASFEAGADEFFCKPISMKRLNQAITHHFADKPC